ncbi:MAG: type I-MYXAN CRISPR-associated protein Cmx8 [Candidatus Electrothrix sp. MAN1_4]|nr:type I-MYXAN CRISPR-associated protein Cmx8 [Candidatus Electrothrix sp. MAN1_4]
MSRETIQNETLTLSYSLFDLPTAQHKAGLAGLLVMIESMRRRGLEPLPEIVDFGPTQVTLALTPESLQVLCDDLFAAEIIEIQVKSKWQGAAPKDTVEVTVEQNGKKKQEKRFVYDILQPKGLFLQTFFPDNNGAWIELWRNMLWNVLRAQPATRKVYEERSRNEPSGVAKELYTSLVKEMKQAEKGKKVTESIAGSVFIGAQSKNAETVSFAGMPSHNFLLHFWHIVTLIFVPRTFTLERAKDKAGRIKWQDHGLAIVIPEPAHLEDFVGGMDFDGGIIEILMGLDSETSGKRPKRAMIDLHQEGGLEYLYYFARQRSRVVDCINAVEIYHIHKQGNNVRMLDAERIVPNKYMLEKYELVRKNRMNPLFKRFYLHNILQGTPWHQGSLDILAAYPTELLVYVRSKTPSNMPYFSIDVGKRLRAIEQELQETPEEEMNTEENQDNLLALRIRGLVRQYVQRKAESKSGTTYKEFKKDEKGKIIYPATYREAVEKVCLDAFLAMRGRREQDFVEYFTGTLCSVPQYLPEDDFLLVSQALINERDKVKSLAMLAVSACSYLPVNKENTKDKQGEQS